MRWRSASPSVTLVVAVGLGWLGLQLLAPDLFHWIHHARGVGEEGPSEYSQLVLLGLLTATWAWLASRHRAHRRALVLAVLMVAQLLLLIVEETDLGVELGLGPPMFGARNIRMALRDAGVIPYFLDAPAMTAFLLFFLLSPLLRFRRVLAWWEGAAPVRARLGDAVAVLLGLPLYLLLFAVMGEKPPTDVLQWSGYLVLAVVTVRVVRATRRA